MRVEIIASACCALPLQIKPGSFTGFTHDALVLCLSASHLSASESSILEAVIHWGREQLASAGGHLSVRTAAAWHIGFVTGTFHIETGSTQEHGAARGCPQQVGQWY